MRANHDLFTISKLIHRLKDAQGNIEMEYVGIDKMSKSLIAHTKAFREEQAMHLQGCQLAHLSQMLRNTR